MYLADRTSLAHSWILNNLKCLLCTLCSNIICIFDFNIRTNREKGLLNSKIEKISPASPKVENYFWNYGATTLLYYYPIRLYKRQSNTSIIEQKQNKNECWNHFTNPDQFDWRIENRKKSFKVTCIFKYVEKCMQWSSMYALR